MALLAISGFIMVIFFMVLLMTKRITAMNALILIPLGFGILLGFGTQVGDMALAGIKKVAPTGVMIAFAMMYFSVMIDTGLFDPLIKAILKASKGDPQKVIVGTALLAGLVSLDGDGATTYIITTTAMFAVHRKLGISSIVLPTIAIMQNGVMNIIPWGGPTGRVMSALGLDASQVFVPLIPSMIAGTIWVLLWAYYLGRKEKKRLGVLKFEGAETTVLDANDHNFEMDQDEKAKSLKRPELFKVNLIMTILLMAALVTELLPLNVLFMAATAIALMINYPSLKLQQERVAEYGTNVIPNISMVLGAGVFTGIMSGTKMIDAMANVLTTSIPPEMGSQLALITALSGLPFTYFLTNDAFYFGIVPILAKSASAYGISTAEIARASLVAQGSHLLSPLVASTYLLIGMNKVTFGELTKSALLPSIVTSLVMLATAILIGVIPV